MPGLPKGFFEHVFRPDFAFQTGSRGFAKKHLKGKSARVVITMGVPAAIYRWYFGAHGLKNLKRNILGFCGIAPVHETLFGMVQGVSNAARNRWIERMRSLGASAS